MFIENLVETHCHILPELDDGARSVEESVHMVQKLQTQGAEKIISTSHYYSDSISLDDFVAKRNAAYKKLKRELPAGSPEILLSAEVYISKYLFHNDDLSPLCIGSSRYILIEHPFSSSFSSQSYDRLANMCVDYNVKPILAHIERYGALMEDKNKLDAFIELGCLTQVNINSFADGSRHTKKKLFKYLESGRIHLIGSDCHNLTTRPPDYSAGVKAIKDKYGDEAIRILINNANILTK